MSKLKSKFSKEIKKEKIEENNNNNQNQIEENEKKNKIKKKAEDYVHLSYDNFLLHYTNGEKAIEKDIKNCKKMDIYSYNRDFIWLIFLGILPYKTSSNWKSIITDNRSLYDSYKKELITNEIEEFIDKKKIENKFHEYYKFQEILSKEDYDILDLIKLDVKRTFQHIDLFHLDKIQKILITILFIFSKKNKILSYRQGMSELCAIFLYVLYKEQVIKSAFIKNDESFLFYLFHYNNEFLEQDTYTMFSKFMLSGFINFFNYNDKQYENSYLNKLSPEQIKTISKKEIINSNDSELKKRIFLLFYDKFPLIDKNLYNFVSDKIYPDLIIFKWFICIFSREFEINHVLHLWDLILLYEFIDKYYSNIHKDKKSKKEKKIDKNDKKINVIKENNIIDNNDSGKNINDEINLEKNYMFIDYIILSMLYKVKSSILKLKSSSKIMAFLMKYPENIDIKDICQKALDFYHKINPNNKI